jgi:hypothetical protein
VDDLVVKWVVGRRTGQTDSEGREWVEPELETVSMTLDGLLRRLRATLLEDDIVAATIQIGEYDLVTQSVRDQTHI